MMVIVVVDMDMDVFDDFMMMEDAEAEAPSDDSSSVVRFWTVRDILTKVCL